METCTRFDVLVPPPPPPVSPVGEGAIQGEGQAPPLVQATSPSHKADPGALSGCRLQCHGRPPASPSSLETSVRHHQPLRGGMEQLQAL